MESSKIYCTSRCRNSTYQFRVANYPVSWVAIYRAENGNMRNFGPTNSHGTAFVPKQWLYMKTKVRVWRIQKCIALVGAETVLISVGPQTTPFHGWHNRVENGNM